VSYLSHFSIRHNTLITREGQHGVYFGLLLFLIELCKQTSTQHQLATAWNFEEFSQHAQVSLVDLASRVQNNLAAKTQLPSKEILACVIHCFCQIPSQESINKTDRQLEEAKMSGSEKFGWSGNDELPLDFFDLDNMDDPWAHLRGGATMPASEHRPPNIKIQADVI